MSNELPKEDPSLMSFFNAFHAIGSINNLRPHDNLGAAIETIVEEALMRLQVMKRCGNAAALREAILAIKDINDRRPHDADGYEINDIIDDVLSAPLRNCDVGTPEEQAVRFDAFVRDRRGDLNCTGKCPAHNGVDFGVVNCVLQWAQMPYEKGAGK